MLLREGAPIHLIEQLRSATEASAVAAASTASPSSLPPRLLSEKQVDLILKTLTSMADGGERAQVSEARGEGRKRERKRERERERESTFKREESGIGIGTGGGAASQSSSAFRSSSAFGSQALIGRFSPTPALCTLICHPRGPHASHPAPGCLEMALNCAEVVCSDAMGRDEVCEGEERKEGGWMDG